MAKGGTKGAVNDDELTQWRRPAVQPHDVVSMLAAPLPTARSGGSSSHNTAAAASYSNNGRSVSAAHRQPYPQPRYQSKPMLQPHVPPQYVHENPLLTKRVYTIREYSEEYYSRPPGQKIYPPGVPPNPIPVPLRPGEKFREYESKFIAHLTARGKSLDDMRDKPNSERTERINFANKRLLPRESCTLRPAQASTTTSSVPSSGANKKRGRSGSPPANRDRSARSVSSAGAAPPRKVQRSHSSPSPARSVASSSSSTRNATRDASSSHEPAQQTATSKSRATATSTPAAAPKAAPSASPTAPPMATPSVPVPASAAATAAPSAPALGYVVAPASVPVQPVRCRAQLPSAQASHSAFVAAYVACSCAQCMCDWNLLLTERLDVLEREVRELRSRPAFHPRGSAAPLKAVDDERDAGAAASDTEDTCSSKSGVGDTHSASGSSRQPGTPTNSVATEPSARPQAAQSTSKNTNHSQPAAPGACVGLLSDPIKVRMLDEYNALNSQILLNEQVVADSLEHVQKSMLDDMATAMLEHEQLQQLQDAIAREAVRRDQALAVLITYVWASKREELCAQMNALGTLNIAHVQRAGHVKCAALAAQITEMHETLEKLKASLEHLLTANTSTGFMLKTITELNALGAEIADKERAIAALEQQRMDEIMRLFQFSHDVRTACRALVDTQT